MPILSSAAITTYDRKIVLILRDDIPSIPDPNQWGVPGGVIEQGETSEEALLREFEEELCIIPKNYTLIGCLNRHKTGGAHVYHVKLGVNEAKNLKLGNEGQRFGIFTFSEMLDLDLVPRIRMIVEKYGDKIQDFLKNGANIVAEDFGLEKL